MYLSTRFPGNVVVKSYNIDEESDADFVFIAEIHRDNHVLDENIKLISSKRQDLPI
jgi:hypothetical protein